MSSHQYLDKLDETEPGVGGEIQMTDALQKLDSKYTVNLKVKHMAGKTDWNGLRHQSNLHLRIMSLRMNLKR